MLMDMGITCVVLWKLWIKSSSSWESLEELIFQMICMNFLYIWEIYSPGNTLTFALIMLIQ